jgi:outer membrane protein TolC
MPWALALASVATAGCVSSGTWSSWHEARGRLEAADEAARALREQLRGGAGEDLGGEAVHSDATGGDGCEGLAAAIVRGHPGLAAPRERARAALAMARADGALPPPSVRLEAWDFPIGDPQRADREGMYMVGVAQELPAGRALDGAARAATEEARVALAELDEERHTILAQASEVCATWAAAHASYARLSSWRDVLVVMREATTGRLSAGGAALADLARVEREEAAVARAMVRAQSEAARARRTLAAWLGAEDLGVEPPALPEGAPVLDADAVLAHAVAHRGLVARGRAAIDAAEARASLEQARATVPDLMVGAAYMQMPGARAGLGVEVGMTLPWLWGGGGDRLEAARAAARAAEAELDGALRGLRAEVTALLGELETSRAELEVLVTREQPAAERVEEASAAAYRGGEGTLLEWLDAVRARRELALEEVEVRATLVRLTVALARAIGASPAALMAPPLAAAPR